ncbi:MAG: outer membrane protein assembly factor BamB family protein [Planctomycetota bacterium]
MRRRALVCTIALVLLGTLPGGAAHGGTAEAIIKASGVKAGLCVHLGVTGGKLTAELSGGGKFLVHGLAADAATVEKARKYIQAKGLYGRVSVERCDLKKLPYAENLVNLVVAEDLGALLGKGVKLEEVARVLAPRGVVCFGGKLDAAKLEAAGFGKVKSSGAWTLAVKPRPKQMDDWTHHRHGPDGNKVSGDLLVGPPARLRWVAGQTWSRRHCWNSMKAMVSAGGRVFYAYDEAPRNVIGPARVVLIARDAHNGVLLWRRVIPSDSPGADDKGRKARPWGFPRGALVASEKLVFSVLAPDGPLAALDAATGKTVREYKRNESPGSVVHYGGTLVLVSKRSISVLDAGSGKELWASPGSAIDVVVADDKVFYQPDWGSFVCKNLKTGADVWKIDTRAWAKGRSHLLFHRDGRLFLGASLGYGKPSLLHVLSAKDGKRLWSHPEYRGIHGSTNVYFAGGLVWVSTGPGAKYKTGAALGLDPASGEVKKDVAFPEYFYKRGHPRCYPNSATARYLLHGSRGTDFIDIETGKVHDGRAFCGDCAFGIVPANGLVYMAPNACTCYGYLGGIRAFAPAGGAKPESTAPALEKGPAYGAGGGGKPGPGDWPTYRGADRRSGVTSAAVPTELKELWAADAGAGPSAPVIAGGRALVASKSDHQVRALDAASGKPLWSFTAGGPIDSPPTIHGGLAIFGCRNGWVYCLSVADGRLAWRLRAAPAERRIIDHGRLESAWPVHGSVLVREGVAYFAAGRAGELDGGVLVYAAEAGTGKVLWRKKAPSLADVLVTGPREKVFMRTWEMDPKTGQGRRKSTHRYVHSGSGLLDGGYAGRRRWQNGMAGGELLVADEERSFAFYGFKRGGKNALSTPGTGEYKISRIDHATRKAAWSVNVPLRVLAMVLAGETLFAAGLPDVVDEKDYWAAFDGKKGGEVWALSAADGKKLSSLKLPAGPVFDGMAAAGGRLYLSCRDGKLRCFGKK